jgi:hypothetical protein
VQFTSTAYSVDESSGSFTISVSRSGDLSASASVEYGTVDFTASERPDYTTSVGTLRFEPGETSKTFTVFITDDTYLEGSETLMLVLTNARGVELGDHSVAHLTVDDNELAPGNSNPIDDPMFYVRQHYVDFLNREPDSSGLDFWTHDLIVCGTNANCADNRRQHVSAAFFLSIEFQQTGYMIYLMQKASYGDMPRYREFLHDMQDIGKGFVVGAPGWETLLEAKKQAFIQDWVNRQSFKTLHDGKSDADFVDALFFNAGVSDLTMRNSFISGLQGGSETRASVLRKITEMQSFSQKEFNPAFVLMQYFGYLRRNPDDGPDNNLDGFSFWLNKLNEHNGDFVSAEMVRAFLNSTEYRQRFGQQ